MDQKLQHKTQFYSFSGVFKFGRKENEKLPLINGHFMTISGRFSASYIEIFHKTEVQMVILRCLVCLNVTLIQSYNIILVKKFFFHAWKCINLRLFCRSVFWHLLGNQLSHFNNRYFFKILWSFHKTLIRWNAGEKIKLFFELSTNKIFGFTFVSILVQ